MSLLDAVEVFEMPGTPKLYGMKAKRALTEQETLKLCHILSILNENGGGIFRAFKDGRN
jgi:hypothetical protein